jgi:hypothetical protein
MDCSADHDLPSPWLSVVLGFRGFKILDWQVAKSRAARRQWLMVAWLLLLLPRLAFADEARTLARRGIECFHRGEYAQAIADFEASYALRPMPSLIYNIAQTHRLAGHCRQAVEQYRRFVTQAPTGPLHDAAMAQLTQLEPCLSAEPSTLSSDDASPADKLKPSSSPALPSVPMTTPTTTSTTTSTTMAQPPTTATTTPATTTAATTTATTTAATKARVPVYRRWWLWTSLGAATTALAVGLGVGLSARPVAYPSTSLPGFHF